MSADLLASVVLPPYKSDRVVIGEYETEELIPQVQVSYRPKKWDTDVQWIESHPVMEDGSIRVVLFAQNYSGHEVTFDVWRAE